MRHLQHSSGDLLADRRAAYAEALSETGDYAGAADLMRQALELAPAWAAGWSQLGVFAERAGDLGGASTAWLRLAELDRAGIFGARLKLAAYGLGDAIQCTDTAYVEALFDDYADRFEASLLQRLHYEVPRELSDRVTAELQRRGCEQVAHAIDLGCGTGLMAERLRSQVSFLEGVDLSANMIDESRRKGIYDRLDRAELTAFLLGHSGGVDLIVASDVLNYCGAPAPVFAAAAKTLRGGGLLAFSLEAHNGPEPMVLRPTLRFAHEADATRTLLRGAGLEIVCFDKGILRLERGEPVEGYFVLARRSSGQPGESAPVGVLAPPPRALH